MVTAPDLSRLASHRESEHVPNAHARLQRMLGYCAAWVLLFQLGNCRSRHVLPRKLGEDQRGDGATRTVGRLRDGPEVLIGRVNLGYLLAKAQSGAFLPSYRRCEQDFWTSLQHKDIGKNRASSTQNMQRRIRSVVGTHSANDACQSREIVSF